MKRQTLLPRRDCSWDLDYRVSQMEPEATRTSSSEPLHGMMLQAPILPPILDLVPILSQSHWKEGGLGSCKFRKSSKVGQQKCPGVNSSHSKALFNSDNTA